MSDEIAKSESEAVERKRDFIGLVAVGFAATDVLTELLATLLPRMGKRWQNLAMSFSWLVFDWGFMLLVIALLLALPDKKREPDKKRDADKKRDGSEFR